MQAALRCLLLCTSLGLAGTAWGLSPGDRVDNFRLLDHAGRSHELYYLSDARAVVLMAYGNGCPIARQALPALEEIRERYRAQGVEFLLIDSNLEDDRDALAREAAEFGVDFPMLADDTQLIGESLGLTRTAEVLVVDPKKWKLAYRGPLDDRLAYGAQKPAATKRYLADALDAVLAGRAVPVPEVDAVGCLIDFPERDRRAAHTQISYAERIAPLLAERCASCHRLGGIGPWAMTSYEMVRGFAPMIREVVRTRRMPPWHADPHYGSFVGDRSLTIDEARTLVHWVEAGAPRGTGPDPLRAQTPASPEWSLGTPDLVVEVPAFAVPATGVVDYQYPRAPNPLGRDVWVRAVEIIPGDRSVVHHVLAGIDDPANGSQRRIRGQIGELGGYAPGKNAMHYPDGTGILLRKEAGFRFQMHYTPNGRATTDVTRVGYYFTEAPPKYPLRMTMLMDTGLSIPAHAKAHTETLEHVFDRDVVLYSLMPHAHLRGRAAKFTAHYPDGRDEVLLSVPKYDFSWQTTYMLRAPKPMPAGTRLEFEITWDNSAQNPANPDPDRVVGWGEQTWDEMNVGWLRYRYTDERAEDAVAGRAAGDERTAAASATAELGSAPPPGQ